MNKPFHSNTELVALLLPLMKVMGATELISSEAWYMSAEIGELGGWL